MANFKIISFDSACLRRMDSNLIPIEKSVFEGPIKDFMTRGLHSSSFPVPMIILNNKWREIIKCYYGCDQRRTTFANGHLTINHSEI